MIRILIPKNDDDLIVIEAPERLRTQIFLAQRGQTMYERR
jgi:hypothetical protein